MLYSPQNVSIDITHEHTLDNGVILVTCLTQESNLMSRGLEPHWAMPLSIYCQCRNTGNSSIILLDITFGKSHNYKTMNLRCLL